MRHAAASLAVLLLLALPAPAPASCPGILCTSLLAPADGATDVALNARIWIGGGVSRGCGLGSPIAVILRAIDGEPELLAQSALVGDAGAVDVYTPAAELRPNTRYFVFLTDDPARDLPTIAVQEGGGTSAFTTGASLDTEAPARPVGRVESTRTPADDPDAQGSIAYLEVEFEGPVLVVDLDDTSRFDASVPDGELTEVSSTAEISVGSGPCLSNWSGAGPGATATVELGTFDVAGNFSGWSEPLEVELSGCGCGAGRGGGLSLLGFGLTAFALRRRRGG